MLIGVVLFPLKPSDKTRSTVWTWAQVVGPRKKLQCEWASEVGQEIRWAGTLV